jgi:RNA polymerase sigma-70 factor, ECF subfamily
VGGGRGVGDPGRGAGRSAPLHRAVAAEDLGRRHPEAQDHRSLPAARREVSTDAAAEAAEVETFDELFAQDGHRASMPLEWGDPERSLERTQFFDVLQACLDHLPASLARIFMMREWLDYDTSEICKELGITPTNCFVMLYRARMRLRECLEMNWFATKGAA